MYVNVGAYQGSLIDDGFLQEGTRAVANYSLGLPFFSFFVFFSRLLCRRIYAEERVVLQWLKNCEVSCKHCIAIFGVVSVKYYVSCGWFKWIIGEIGLMVMFVWLWSVSRLLCIFTIILNEDSSSLYVL